MNHLPIFILLSAGLTDHSLCTILTKDVLIEGLAKRSPHGSKADGLDPISVTKEKVLGPHQQTQLATPRVLSLAGVTTRSIYHNPSPRSS